ncbi:cupin domain-containing protein [Chitinimonas sp.]|uniref:cupin domain-containing protein n=1 Tax=Chitinimonas sp. TaxID=1934313 RepID=UPI0035B3E8AD
MQTFHLDALSTDRQTLAEPYHEFLRAKDMSAGLYHLQPGSPDPQGPHQEDELYYVIRGAGAFEIDGNRIEVSAGSILHVPARVPHRFVDVREALDVLVVFAPAESAPTVAIPHSA